MPSIAEFYSDAHRGNPFGVKGPLYGSSGHRGDDTNRWKVGTPIPSFVEGVVVRSEYQSGLGWVVVVFCARLATWVGYCHMRVAGLPAGTTVRIGDTVGQVGNTGNLSTGAHVHVTCSATGSNPATSSVFNPRPLIERAKTAAAGSTAALIQNQTTEDDAMFRLINRGGVWWAVIITSISILEINSKTDPNEYYAAYRIWGDASKANFDPASERDITEEDLRIEYVQLAKRISAFKAALGGLPAAGTFSLSDADVKRIAQAVIVEQKLPGN